MSNKLKTIPLCQLKRSKTNVRKTEPHAEVEQLAASIEANGLLENLVVHPATSGSQDDPVYEVIAGGRRLAALRLLAKRGKIEKDHPIACLIKANGIATEISLAENFVRVPVHPADQCDAFAALHREGLGLDDIASRFGITSRFVQQRLKLAGVSPRLIAEYRAGAMTLEQLTAFTLCDDYKAQEEVWFDSPYGNPPAHAIRRLLTKAQVEGTDRRARFVGVKAYEAAGGIVVRDLFDTEDEGYFSDSQLLDRLVAEMLGALAESVRAEGWQWVEIHPDSDLLYLGHFGHAKTCEIELSKAEEKRLSKLSKRYDELVAALEEDDIQTPELDRVSAEIDLLQQKKEIWPDEEKARAGAIVHLGADGEPGIIRGLVRREENGHDRSEERQARKRSRANGYSEAVLLDLSAHRTAALREVLAQQPDTALLALLHALVDRLFFGGSPESCLGIGANVVELERISQATAEGKAGRAFQTRHAAWAERLPDKETCWDRLVQLEGKDRLALLAHCVSTTVNALDGRQGAGAEKSYPLAQAAGLDMHDWWCPTSEDFLDRLTKNEILAAVSEGVSPQASRNLAGLKKDKMAKAAEKLLAGSGWLPAPFKPGAPEAVPMQ